MSSITDVYRNQIVGPDGKTVVDFATLLAGGGGGGGGGDASAANQTTEIARLTSILAKLPIAAASLATSQATAGSASGELVAARATAIRRILLRNTHATDGAYIGPGTVTSANGFLVPAGAAISLDTSAAINGIRAGSADVAVHIVEEYT